MPLLDSSYHAKWPFTHAHVNTIYPGVLRRVAAIPYERTTIDTPDGDFLDLDWWKNGHQRLIIALHGLEGSADRPYIRGLFHQFSAAGWDALGMNFRSCSGRPNRRLRSYNMGETHDLKLVVQHAISQGYLQIVLAGFSLGGNVVLKYMGESGPALANEIKAAVAFSVPCHLATAKDAIAHPTNWIYVKRFLGTLNEKMKAKVVDYPGQLALPKQLPRTFKEFDGQFTAPIHGYHNEEDYYNSCASVDFMANIDRPTLLVNAQDDTFLSPQCFPRELAQQHPFLYLETPAHGGHCGFHSPGKDGSYWSERRAVAFVEEHI